MGGKTYPREQRWLGGVDPPRHEIRLRPLVEMAIEGEFNTRLRNSHGSLSFQLRNLSVGGLDKPSR